MERMGRDSMRAALIYQHRTAAASQAVADAMSAQIEAFERGDGDGASTRLGLTRATRRVKAADRLAITAAGSAGVQLGPAGQSHRRGQGQVQTLWG